MNATSGPLPIAVLRGSVRRDRIGNALDPRLTKAMDRFLDEFSWYPRAFKRERAQGTPY